VIYRKVLPITIFCVSVLVSCGEEKTPSRDHIPLIKESIARLQKGVIDRNPAALDSLMSVDILKYKQSSDSLLKFIHGPNDEYGFNSFSQADIVYTDEIAKVECLLKGSDTAILRPITLTFVYDHDMWLLSRFEIDTTRGEDSL
jgi:hypothetical protein